MKTAGVTQPGGPVVLLELPGPGGPGPGEVLLDVRAGGVGNWDEFVRTGGWETPASGRRWRSASRRPGGWPPSGME